MSSANGHAKRSEKGLLTPDNCVVTLIDHQPQMLFGVSNFDRQSIINNTVAFAKATRVFDVPVVLTTVETPDLKRTIVDGVMREASGRSVEQLAEEENELLVGLLSLRARQG